MKRGFTGLRLGTPILAWLILSSILGHTAQAHEAYVVDHDYFWNELSRPYSAHATDALDTTINLRIVVYVTIGVFALLTLNFLFRRSNIGQHIHAFLERFARFGPMFVRAAIAVAFIFSGASNSFLGPELNLSSFPFPPLMQSLLVIIGILFAVGLFTEIAALLGLTMFALAYKLFGSYLLTYANYLGELIVLFLFGMRTWSFDAKLLGPLSTLRVRFEKYETTIVRILYGVGLIYAGITIKLLHPDLTSYVATNWHLTQFNWLFPADPLLITFGAGIAEVVVGLFIIFGFELRLTVLISLFYMTLSLLYFRELVWPHLLLYGISLNLLVQPEVFTLDHIFFKKHRQRARWWLRPLRPHRHKGKSHASAL